MSKILICDDNLPAARVVAKLLANAGHSGVCAGNAGEALVLLENEGADLILLDELIPYVSGNEMLRMLRVHPKLKKIPVVVWSGLDDPTRINTARQLGAADYLVKARTPWPEMLRRMEACLPPSEKNGCAA